MFHNARTPILSIVLVTFIVTLVSCSTAEPAPPSIPHTEAPIPPSDSAIPVDQETLDELLVEAVWVGDGAEAERLLDAGANANAVDASGDAILNRAILRRSADIVEMLIEYGAEVNAPGDASVVLAARFGQPDIVQILLDGGADVNSAMDAKMPDGTTLWQAPALTHAALVNQVEVVELLIAFGADLDQTDMVLDVTPLHAAAERNHAEIVRILLDNGADPEPHCKILHWETPMHHAVASGAVEAIEALSDGGADVDARVVQGMTPMISLINEGHVIVANRIVPVLLERGADPNLQLGNGNTALHLAAKLGRITVIPLLIEGGATIDLPNDHGDTPLHLAAMSDEVEAVEILIEHGASLDVRNNRGESAIDVATDDSIVEMLREASAGD